MQKEEVSLSIAVLRPLLILMVCLVHAPYISSYLSHIVSIENIQTLIGPFLKDTFVRGAVPLLSVISGYLAYSSFNSHKFHKFIYKKIKRLLVPFIMLNIIFSILFYIGYSLFNYPNVGSSLHAGDINEVLKITFGVNRIPINTPTYFLRDLFIVTFLTPIFSIISKKYLHIFISFVLLTSLFTFFPIWTFFGYSLLYRYDIIFFYFIGFCLARHNVLDYLKISNHQYTMAFTWFALVCLMITLLLVEYKITSFDYTKVKPLFGVLFLAVVPSLINLIISNKDSFIVATLLRYSPYSFTLFLIHSFVAMYLPFVMGDWWLAVNNTSSAYLQILSILTYLSITVIFSICIAKIYWMSRRKIKSSIEIFKRSWGQPA